MIGSLKFLVKKRSEAKNHALKSIDPLCLDVGTRTEALCVVKMKTYRMLGVLSMSGW